MNIIITGTSRGIGLELALQLADQGHQIIAISRKENSKLSEHPNVHYFGLDLTLKSDLDKLAQVVTTNFKTIDAIVHNAGALVNKPFEEITPAEFEYVYQVNVFGVAYLNQAILPYLNNPSHVVTISSMGGIQGSMKFPGLAAYSSSKGAVITLSELLAEEYKDRGICFNVLALGAVQTEMLEEAFPGYQAPLTAAEMAQFIAHFTLNGHKYQNGKVIQVANSTP